MKPTDIIRPLTLEEVQTLRRLSRHPDFRQQAADFVALLKTNRDQVQGLTEDRRTELADYEAALVVADRKVQEAEAIMAELEA